jgi:hypothetical protein
MSLQTLLGLSVLGAIISTIGSLIGLVFKEMYFSRSFDKWKRQQDLAQTYQKFKDPLVVAAIELITRLIEIVDHYPSIYLHSAVFELRPDRQLENNISDPYFQRHKLISTLYRFNAFFGWLELYRQEITFLKADNEVQTVALERALSCIREDLADGGINNNDNWRAWHDTLIFREELRAIGESMIEAGPVPTVVGFGKFRERLDADEASQTKQWALVPMNFFLDPDMARPDFRLERLKRLTVHLADLIELLNASALSKDFRDARQRGKNSQAAWKPKTSVSPA